MKKETISPRKGYMRIPHHCKWINTVLSSRSIFWLGTAIGIIWALPLTLVGIVLALPVWMIRGHILLIKHPAVALLIRGPTAHPVLSRHPWGAMSAMALGHVIIAEDQNLSFRLLIHELTHVRQAACWGILFPVAYLASSAWAKLCGRDAYWYNRFEIAARKAEKHPY